jgi:hypothetical protein
MRHLITSALPYINGVKHLGNLVGSMLPADVYARYLRARGHEVLAICATDEHGTPAELSALEAGLPVDEYCTKMHEVQADLGRRFSLSFDHFGRSSSPQNRELTQHFAARLAEHGFLIERVTKQVYSIDDNRFLADRYVAGTCPHCGSDKARGDQCDSCTRVLDPADLIKPYSTLSGSTRLELRDSKHLFIDLPALGAEVRAWIDSHRTTGPRSPPRSPTSGSTRASRPAASPATSSGACRSIAPATRTRCSTCGSTRRSSTWARPRSGPIRIPRTATGRAGGRAATPSATRSSWRRTTCPSTPSSSRRRSSAAASRGSSPTT